MLPLSFADYLRGAAYGFATILIWSGWLVAAQISLRTSLTPWDIVALRFGVAGVILLPYLLRQGIGRDRLGWGWLAVLALGGGAPTVLLSNTGMLFAPTAHAGALFSGVMPVLVAILAAFVLGERFTTNKAIGFGLILLGVVAIVWQAGGTIGEGQTIGHLMFLGAALLWACYTVAMRRGRFDGLHAAAIAAVSSMIVYLPLYVWLADSRIPTAPWSDIALQAFVQGILTAILSFLLYGRAVAILGASRGAAFGALVPAMTALMAIPVLGERPTTLEWGAILLISFGVYVVSAGLRWRRAT
jgi:drug/metabolite transporter (DMT)-like permease